MIEYTKSYKIPVYETDFHGKLYLHSLLNYVQDIAAEHAELLHFGRDDLKRANQFWILSRLYALINRMPGWGETITLKTWPRGTEGLFALRDIEIMDAGGKIISSVTTSWVVVDIDTRRPCRPESLPESMNREFPSAGTLERNAARLAPFGHEGRRSPSFRVKPSDLDINYHVNNVKYVQWIYDSLSVNFLSQNLAGSLEINYLAESVEGDILAVDYRPCDQGNNCSGYSVIRLEQERELCRVIIGWKPVRNEKVL
ncbi:MAG: thioesterase [Bacteroidales bacterium]|jgi:acyl-ACP thioesterase|nr:thioesterase [Bacteroidales bacterium]